MKLLQDQYSSGNPLLSNFVVYKRLQDLVAPKQDPEPVLVLREALDTLEKEVCESCNKPAQPDTHRDTQIEAV